MPSIIVNISTPLPTTNIIQSILNCLSLAYLSHRLKVSFCDPMMSIVHHRCPSLVNNLLKQHLFLNHMVDCHQTSQEWSLGGRPPFRVVLKIPFHAEFWMPWQPKNLLVKNYWSDFKIIWYKWSLGDHLPKLFKLFWLVEKHGHKRVWPVFLLVCWKCKGDNTCSWGWLTL